ncbi:acyltransferase family protein [Bradyrhizobium sp. dw_411]|uniref:acyltransferase family protein n=1 Tax=Bradyrhizobium sp. dw_411 TaxID=2720082 RepID=UPI001BD003D6|nr:acyltransferase family protein [Bradyrhizobium sp. dw_411]
MSQLSDQYRPDIDGLRAIAVLLVVGFHAFPEAVPGGFIGVDIFFVISGFLITGIIARELGQQHFGLLAFYARRIRRIFPALIVVLGVTLVLGWLWLLPQAYAQLSSDVFASAAFVSNIALWLQSGYFDIESSRKPLLHLWSLGIEEQFYLFWPLILMLAARLRLSLLAVASLIAIASLALNVALIGPDPVATFYLPFTRAWELLAGAALACGWSHIRHTPAASNLRAAAGILLIAIAAGVLDSKNAFPGWWALLPVAGAALMISAPMAWGCRHLLASPAMVRIGLISYPLYLWHWPLLVFSGIIKFAPLTLLERALIVGLSFALAWLTYRFIEIPFRFGRPTRPRIAALCSGMALVALAGGVIVRGDGFDFRLPAEIRDMAAVKTESFKWRFRECLLDLGHETSFADDCVDRNRRPLIMLWGDSTAGALLLGLRKAQETHDFGIAQFTSNSCIPAVNVDISGVPNCRAINDKVLTLARQIQPDIVLLHSTWAGPLDGVAAAVTALKQQTGARIIVLGSVPWWKRGLPNEVLRYFMLHRRLIPERSDRATADPSEARLREKLTPLGAEFISAWETLCNADGCLARIGDTAQDISASDQVHLTEKGSIFLIQSIIGRVLAPHQ